MPNSLINRLFTKISKLFSLIDGMVILICIAVAFSTYAISDQVFDQMSFVENDKPGITPALVIVHITQSWTDYSSLTEFSNPYFDTPFVFP